MGSRLKRLPNLKSWADRIDRLAQVATATTLTADVRQSDQTIDIVVRASTKFLRD